MPWTLLMPWKVSKEVYNLIKYQQVGKVSPIHQERISLYGSMNWFRDVTNFNNGHQSLKHQSHSVSLIFSILWVSLLLLCKRLQEIKYCHLITWLYKLMSHSLSQLRSTRPSWKRSLYSRSYSWRCCMVTRCSRTRWIFDWTKTQIITSKIASY